MEPERVPPLGQLKVVRDWVAGAVFTAVQVDPASVPPLGQLYVVLGVAA